jgi:hypothetical protein
MAEDIKHSGATSSENEFIHYNDLTSVLKLTILDYSTPSALGRMACVSRETNDLSGKDVLWKFFLDRTQN